VGAFCWGGAAHLEVVKYLVSEGVMKMLNPSESVEYIVARHKSPDVMEYLTKLGYLNMSKMPEYLKEYLYEAEHG
jgi:flavorubredoxin